jgi:hypothetical protein
VPSGQDPRHDLGTGPPAAQDAAFGASGVGGLADIGHPEPEHRAQHGVGPRVAARRVLGAQHEVNLPPPAEGIQHETEQAPGQPGDETHPHPGPADLLQRLGCPWHGGQPGAVNGQPVGTVKGELGGFGAPRGVGEQRAEHVDGGLPAGLVDVDHAAGVRRGAGDDALGGESLGEGPLQDAAVIRGDPEQSTTQQGDRCRAAHLEPPSSARPR